MRRVYAINPCTLRCCCDKGGSTGGGFSGKLSALSSLLSEALFIPSRWSLCVLHICFRARLSRKAREGHMHYMQGRGDGKQQTRSLTCSRALAVSISRSQPDKATRHVCLSGPLRCGALSARGTTRCVGDSIQLTARIPDGKHQSFLLQFYLPPYPTRLWWILRSFGMLC